MRDVSRLLSFLVIVLAAVAGATSAAFAVPQAFRGDPALKPLVSGLPRLQIPLPAHKSHGKIKHVVSSDKKTTRSIRLSDATNCVG